MVNLAQKSRAVDKKSLDSLHGLSISSYTIECWFRKVDISLTLKEKSKVLVVIIMVTLAEPLESGWIKVTRECNTL